MGKVISLGTIAEKIDGIPVDASLPCNWTNYTSLASRRIEYLVAHYTGNARDTAWANAHWYHEAVGVGASAHFFVDETAIYQSVGLKDRAGHCGATGTYYHSACRNNNSIGIEMCCSGSYKISEKTKRHAAYLFAYLCRMLPAVPFRVKITASALNVRSGPGTTYSRSAVPVGRDEVYTIIDTSPNGWGKLKSGVGWICLDYVEVGATVAEAVPGAVAEMGASTTVTTAIPDISVQEVSYTVLVTASALNVRVGPGTGYGISREVSSVRKGDKYTIVETQGNWGRLKSGAGWICLDYTTRGV